MRHSFDNKYVYSLQFHSNCVRFPIVSFIYGKLLHKLNKSRHFYYSLLSKIMIAWDVRWLRDETLGIGGTIEPFIVHIELLDPSLYHYNHALPSPAQITMRIAWIWVFSKWNMYTCKLHFYLLQLKWIIFYLTRTIQYFPLDVKNETIRNVIVPSMWLFHLQCIELLINTNRTLRRW